MEQRQLSAVIAAARAGCEQAYQELVGCFGPRLYGYFLRATGSADGAEELLGELMLRLVRGLPEFDDRGRFEPWIFSIAANLVRDRIRRWRTHPPAVSLDGSTDEQSSLGETIVDETAADDSLARGERQKAVRKALSTLDDRSRQMVLLRYFGELSFKEIAGMFECPIGTVLARVHRAHKALRKVLEGLVEDA
jgi:RNA polymerase sigma-70 factor (ECF subfamily)